jgi:hypothetical protein
MRDTPYWGGVFERIDGHTNKLSGIALSIWPWAYYAYYAYGYTDAPHPLDGGGVLYRMGRNEGI